MVQITKVKIRKLKEPKLRKIRYEIRTLCYLLYRKEMLRLRNSPVLFAHQKFHKHFMQRPIICWGCGNRMRDLVQDPISKFWFCADNKCTLSADKSLE